MRTHKKGGNYLLLFFIFIFFVSKFINKETDDTSQTTTSIHSTSKTSCAKEAKEDEDIKKIKELGSELKEANEQNNDEASSANIASVNGIKIARAKFNNLVISSKYNELNQSEKELLNIMIDNSLLIQEAKKLGISISDEEVQEDIDRLKTAYEDSPDNRKLVDAYINALDITFDEFLENNRKSTLRDKTIAKLREKILGKHINISESKTNPDWIKYKKDLREKAEIIIYDEDLR